MDKSSRGLKIWEFFHHLFEKGTRILVWYHRAWTHSTPPTEWANARNRFHQKESVSVMGCGMWWETGAPRCMEMNALLPSYFHRAPFSPLTLRLNTTASLWLTRRFDKVGSVNGAPRTICDNYIQAFKEMTRLFNNNHFLTMETFSSGLLV